MKGLNTEDYKYTPIKELFDKDLLITGLTFDSDRAKGATEETPFVMVYIEDQDEHVKFKSRSKILLKQLDEIKVPCRGEFVEKSGERYTYYSFEEEEHDSDYAQS